MINELHGLSTAMARSGIKGQVWHRKYKPIPNIRANAPCVRIDILDGKVVALSEVKPELGANLRKYGSNQGAYPCMNLAPLYRVTDNTVREELEKINPENMTADTIAIIKKWCSENNWKGNKFQSKYRISMEQEASELARLVPDFKPLQALYEQSCFLLKPEDLHQEIKSEVFRMLQDKANIPLALKVLFYFGKPNIDAADDYGTLSVAFDSPALFEVGTMAVSETFVQKLNTALVHENLPSGNLDSVDAFGIHFEALEEPMPEVKLAGGFSATLRTMFKDQRCQKRYGLIGNASYPISPKMRRSLQSALDWLGSEKHRDITWTKTDMSEIMFVYPSQLPEEAISFTRMFQRPPSRDLAFKEQARQFISELRQGRDSEIDSKAEYIQLFILRKIDKARTKVIYTRQTDSYELEKCSEAWATGCSENLPRFPFGQPNIPYPLDVSDVLNRFWKQNGDICTEKFKPIPKYHGLELLMELGLPVTSDLQNVARQAMTVGAFLGRRLVDHDMQHPIWNKAKDMLALMGLLLYRVNIRKDSYMENLPYLYGQLLKTSDELHALYCKVVRKGNLPPQLAGGGLYQAAAEAPIRTLNLLGQRIMPYYTWARSYRSKGVQEDGIESWRAGWLYSMYERIATKLYESWTQKTKFSDEDKAQFFIGYLAAFPRSEREVESRVEEEQNNE